MPLDSVNPKGGGLKTLDDCRFVAGDILSVAVLSGAPSAANPAVAGAPGIPASRSAPFALGGRGGPQLNGPASSFAGRGGFSIRGRGAGFAGAFGDRRASDSAAFGRGVRTVGTGTGADADRWDHVGDGKPAVAANTNGASEAPRPRGPARETGWGRSAPSRERERDERIGRSGYDRGEDRGRSRSRSPPPRRARAPSDGW